MIPPSNSVARREQIIAALLWYGTWFASALIAAGMLLGAVPLPPSLLLPLTGHDLVKLGVAVFILLPITRVGLMLAIFLRERDWIYAMIAALVLAIIAIGVALEI
ncbi:MULTISPECIES: DUF1634 domain-containing protein [unclassified Rhizobium]|uniref:DUF1634 domain-containing protein n=1 Tax=unclassified Rhizobium TaxID=2613769 RepID=UPI0037F21D8F